MNKKEILNQIGSLIIKVEEIVTQIRSIRELIEDWYKCDVDFNYKIIEHLEEEIENIISLCIEDVESVLGTVPIEEKINRYGEGFYTELQAVASSIDTLERNENELERLLDNFVILQNYNSSVQKNNCSVYNNKKKYKNKVLKDCRNNQIIRLRNSGMSIREIAKEMGVSKTTVQTKLNERRDV